MTMHDDDDGDAPSPLEPEYLHPEDSMSLIPIVSHCGLVSNSSSIGDH